MAFLGVLESSQNNNVNFQFSCQFKRNMGLGMEIFLSVKIHILQITMLQQISLALLQYMSFAVGQIMKLNDPF